MKRLMVANLFLFAVFQGFSQKVGLVLSGGGARGLAHIGVIRVLEENNIPIDYITGTSMGAIVGGLYAAGFTPDEMEEMFRSEEFYFWSTGKIQEQYRYYYNQPEDNPSWINLRMERKEDKLKLLPPTNIIPQWQMDFTFMELLAPTTAISNNSFDNLFVPYRCVACEAYRNEQVVLSRGDLGEAIRASMTVPFVFKPIEIEGKLLFDGGLVNNFPHDIMKETFKPDVTIGHKVANDPRSADPDDLIRQISNLIQRPTDYDIHPDDGILLETDVSAYGIFDFQKLDEMMEAGSRSTTAMIDSIKKRIQRRVEPEEIARRREAFRAVKPALLFRNIQVEGVDDPLQRKYIINAIKHNKEVFTIEMFRKNYFKLITDHQIKAIRPVAIFNNESGYFDIHLIVEPEKKGEINIGGNISTKPINQGYFDFRYRLFKNRSYTLSSNLYFGRFYSSFKMGGRIDFPAEKPFYLASNLTYNRWDFFASSSEFFFEDVRPPYIIQNETNFRNEIGFPIGLHNKMSFGAAWSSSRDIYYQIEKYNKSDNPDLTDFSAFVTQAEYVKNSLNAKQHAYEGIHQLLSLRYITGKEKDIPGTTLAHQGKSRQNHNYLLFRASLERYYPVTKSIIAGIQAESVFSNKKLFRNYTSTVLSSPGFYPTPHSKTIYVKNYHNNNYLAGGIKAIYLLKPQIHVRLEGYTFAPIHEIQAGNDLKAVKSDKFIRNLYYQGMGSLVWDTGLGPASIGVNYYDKSSTKWYLMFNFGYILFNKRGL